VKGLRAHFLLGEFVHEATLISPLLASLITLAKAYTRKNAQVVTNVQQTCGNAVSTTCQEYVFALLVDKLSTACWQLATRLLSSTDLLQVVPTTCYCPAIQQFVGDNVVATWWNTSIVTTCWQVCYKPVANTSCWQVCYKAVANTSCWQVALKQSCEIFTCVQCSLRTHCAVSRHRHTGKQKQYRQKKNLRANKFALRKNR
jgi:hypothetical protein